MGMTAILGSVLIWPLSIRKSTWHFISSSFGEMAKNATKCHTCLKMLSFFFFGQKKNGVLAWTRDYLIVADKQSIFMCKQEIWQIRGALKGILEHL